MADVISTIKPAGGGDFTTLASWYTWTQSQSDPGPSDFFIAECYDGGNLGDFLLNSTYHNYKIVAAAGQRHNGTFGSSGAYTLGNINAQNLSRDIIVEGIRFANGATFYSNEAAANGVHQILVDSCLFEMTGGLHAIYFGVYNHYAQNIFTARNNIFINDATSPGLDAVRVVSYEDGFDANITVYLYNNSVDGVNLTNYGVFIELDYLKGNAYANVVCFNNIILRTPNGCFGGAGSGYNASNDYNAVSDTSAIGSNSLLSQTASNIWVTPGTDLTLKSTSPCKDVGTTIGSFSSDALHGTGWRPQGTAWDMGALELAGSGPSPVDQTQLGKARIQKIVDQTQLGKANIQGTTDKTILGKSNIQVIEDKTIQGKARIQVISDKTQLGEARIQKIINRTTQGKANIVIKTDKTIQGKARIINPAPPGESQVYPFNWIGIMIS